MKKFLFRKPWAAGLFLTSITFAFAAHAALVQIGHGNAKSSFIAKGPAGLKIDGEGKGVTASESGGTITVKAPLTGLKTGITLRDDHLKKALKVEKNPHATLTVKRASIKFPAAGKPVSKASAKGNFTLNGVTKEIPFFYDAQMKGANYEVDGFASIDITKFQIDKPCYLGVCVDENVKVKVSFKVKDK